MSNIYVLSLIKKTNTVILGLLATVFINRTLGPELLGDYAYIVNIINILLNIANFGITAILPNYNRKKESWVKDTFYSLVFIQFVLYLCIGVALAMVLNKPVFMLYALVLASEVLSLQILNCTIVYNFLVSTIANSVAVFVNATYLFILFVNNTTNINLVLLALAIKGLTSVVICLPSIIIGFNRKTIKPEKWLGILSAGLVPMMISLMTILNYKVDILELKWLQVPSSQIGLYSVGLGFAEYALIIVDVFKDVLINKTADNDNIEHVCFSMRCSSTMLVLSYLVLVVAGKILIVFLYGSDYAGAYSITILTMIGVYSMMFLKLLGTLYIARGEWNYYFKVMMMAAITNIIINYVLIPFWGIYGAAIATIISYSIIGMLFFVRFCKEYDIRYRDALIIKKEDFKSIHRVLTNKIQKKED